MPPKKKTKTKPTKTTNKRGSTTVAAATVTNNASASTTGAAPAIVKKEDAANLEKMKKQKGKNFTKDEDYTLAKAYVHVTDDPINGCHQGGEHFWKKVLETYELMWDGAPIVVRDWEALQTRFSKHMLNPIQKFQSIFLTIKNKNISGTTEEDWVRQAHQIFRAKEKGKGFAHEAVWRVLRNSLPKFSENESSADPAVSATGTPFNNISSGQGASLPKPTGSKHAKGIQKTQDAIHQVNKTSKSQMDSLISLTRNIASTLVYDSTLSGYKAFMDMANSYKAQGNQEKCDLMMRLAEEQIMQAQSKPPQPLPPDQVPAPSSNSSSTNNSSLSSRDEVTTGLNLLGAVSNAATPLANGNAKLPAAMNPSLEELLSSDDEDDPLFKKNLDESMGRAKSDKPEVSEEDTQLDESQLHIVSQGRESPSNTQMLQHNKAIYESTTAAFQKSIQDEETQADELEVKRFQDEARKEMERIKKSIGLGNKGGDTDDNDSLEGVDIYG